MISKSKPIVIAQPSTNHKPYNYRVVQLARYHQLPQTAGQRIRYHVHRHYLVPYVHRTLFNRTLGSAGNVDNIFNSWRVLVMHVLYHLTEALGWQVHWIMLKLLISQPAKKNVTWELLFRTYIPIHILVRGWINQATDYYSPESYHLWVHLCR